MAPANKRTFVQKASLVAAIVATLAALCLQLATCEPDSGAASSADPSSEFGPPKRQYLIAPRIGRSAGAADNLATIWSALEEAALSSAGQPQPSRALTGPLRSSLLFLVGNRRIIGPRSGGLLPQARIGRRSAPIGLMPQPRVGRRADQSASDDLDGQESAGQQEVAMASLSDTTFDDALASLMNGKSLTKSWVNSSVAAASAQDRPGGENSLERGMHRATSFVPRLGKRERAPDLERNIEQLLCTSYNLNCPPAGQEAPLLLLLLASLARDGNPAAPLAPQREPSANPTEAEIDFIDLVAQQLKREPRAMEATRNFVGQQLYSPGAGTKRVPFTPRIG